MTHDQITDRYFEWMYNLVCAERYSESISYRKLLTYLHGTVFRWSIPRDENRARDGVDLRYRFAYEYAETEDAETYLNEPCSVLEIMVALAIKCEETIMDDPYVGNRVSQWFWNMVTNLGLGSMTDDAFDRRFVADTIDRFLDREYRPDGKGGLFVIRSCKKDLRTVEIWHQLCWYLDTI